LVFSYSRHFIFFLRVRRPAASTLFPYTTLFRSGRSEAPPAGVRLHRRGSEILPRPDGGQGRRSGRVDGDGHADRRAVGPAAAARSEEHTSELQSQSNLVCRLLLEKKKSARYKSL